MIGAVTPGWPSSQLSETCAGEAPTDLAIRLTASMVAQLRSDSAYSADVH